MRRFKRWVTQYHQIMLHVSLSKFGMSEYAENSRFWDIKPE